MNTEILRIDACQIDIGKISYAAGILRKGGLVAFPTETVYGLGANAMDGDALKKIYDAKGRPSDNPLIIHIADKNDVNILTLDIPDCARNLMDRFWPGPLTLVMKKSAAVMPVITAGLDTVALRMPSHPVALALIKEAGIPVAAPSANLSGKPSPTSAEHVIEDLTGRVNVIIDAGPTGLGLESTVLDLTVKPPVVLRPGGVTLSQLAGLIGEVAADKAISNYGCEAADDSRPRSPGMKYRHYSPVADMLIIDGRLDSVVKKIYEMAGEYCSNGIRAGILATDQTKYFYNNFEVLSLGDRDKPGTIASRLFGLLREFDRRGVSVIIAEGIDDTGIGAAIMNRMIKAAGGKLIRV